MKTAIFGGSFDPIHEGHLTLVRGVAAQLSLDRVVLMPTGRPPHKVKVSATTDEQRLAMCRAAVKDDPIIEVSDFEIQKGGASFTVDTLEEMCRREPQTQWHLLMGADMFLTLASWKRFEDVVKMAVLCTVPRDDISKADLLSHVRELEALGATCRVCDMPTVRVSSTDVRRRVAAGASIDALVPKAVVEYIAQNGLYRATENVDRDAQFVEIIRARLTPQRFEHSLAVAAEARRLAEKWGADPDKAYTAGLLHDVLKNTKPEMQLQILSDFDILLDDVEKKAPKLWHAKSGAAFVEHVLGVEDKDIVSAIRFHTTAKADMTPLERVLFLADFTSADRDYPDVDVMRRLVDENLSAAMVYAMSYTIKELVDGGKPVHPDTWHAYNELTLSKGV